MQYILSTGILPLHLKNSNEKQEMQRELKI